MALGTTPNRAGQPPRRNTKWEELETKQHARTQSEMVESIMLERNKGRLGLKTHDMGNSTTKGPNGTIIPDRTPASKLAEMDYDAMQGFFLNALKSYRTIQRLEAYKDDRLLKDEFFDARIAPEHFNLSHNVFKSLVHLSDKLAVELSKPSVAGVDINAEGEFWIYYWKPEEAKSKEPVVAPTLKGGRGKKKVEKEPEMKEEEVLEEKPVSPVIRIHYMLD